MLSWNFLVNGFAIRAILSIMGMEMDARHRFQAFPLNVYPIPSTALRIDSSVAGPLMVRVLAEALALAFSTPGTSSTARTTAARRC